MDSVVIIVLQKVNKQVEEKIKKFKESKNKNKETLKLGIKCTLIYLHV